MKINEIISNRLKFMAIMAMLAVIWLHGYPIYNSPNVAKWNYFLQSFFWIYMTTWAVPAFFMMSGYFFVWSLRNGYKFFFKKKIHQLLIPYIFWCCLGAAFLIPLNILDNYRKGIYLLKNTCFEPRQIIECLNRFFALSYHGPDVNGPLWYLRTLIVIFLFSPVLYEVIYKRIPSLWICFVSLIGLMLNVHIPYLYIDIDHLAWFILGVGIMKGHYIEFKHEKKYIIYFLFVAVCWIIGALLLEGILLNDSYLWVKSHVMSNTVAFLGIVSMYFITIIVEKMPKSLAIISNTFWIYCCHFPICMWIKSIGRYLVHENDYGLLFVAILTPMLTLFFCVAFQKSIQHFSPRLFALLNGGR